jgi:YebC/PmpR family DNA-binding regulatory protein
MSGHSKWNNIKNRKGAADAKKSKEFAQVAKLIRIAVKEGKSDNPDFNPRLRVMLDKARAANMPKDKIEKAIERGSGKTKAGTQLHEVLYEGYGPAGVALLIQAVTDNPTRTSSEIKFVFSRNGGTLAGPHAAQFLFQRAGDGVSFSPLMPQELAAADLETFLSLLDALEAQDDVEEVFHTALLPESAQE